VRFRASCAAADGIGYLAAHEARNSTRTLAAGAANPAPAVGRGGCGASVSPIPTPAGEQGWGGGVRGDTGGGLAGHGPPPRRRHRCVNAATRAPGALGANLRDARARPRVARAGDGNRTRIADLEGRCSTTELHPRWRTSLCPGSVARVGEGGFEPPASCSQSRCAAAALLPGSTPAMLVLPPTGTPPNRAVAGGGWRVAGGGWRVAGGGWPRQGRLGGRSCTMRHTNRSEVATGPQKREEVGQSTASAQGVLGGVSSRVAPAHPDDGHPPDNAEQTPSRRQPKADQTPARRRPDAGQERGAGPDDPRPQRAGGPSPGGHGLRGVE
jgi:hypothetical protein